MSRRTSVLSMLIVIVCCLWAANLPAKMSCEECVSSAMSGGGSNFGTHGCGRLGDDDQIMRCVKASCLGPCSDEPEVEQEVVRIIEGRESCRVLSDCGQVLTLGSGLETKYRLMDIYEGCGKIECGAELGAITKLYTQTEPDTRNNVSWGEAAEASCTCWDTGGKKIKKDVAQGCQDCCNTISEHVGKTMKPNPKAKTQPAPQPKPTPTRRR